MRNSTPVLALLIAASLAPISKADGRKQLWNVDLLKLIGQAGDSEAQYVWGLAFSPDESKLAIGFNYQGRAAASHVIVVSVDHPSAVLRRFDSDHSVGPEAMELYVRENIQWSPSGNFLAAYRQVFSVQGERSCPVPTDFEFGGFLADDRIVIAKRAFQGLLGPEATNEIQVRRPDCTVEDSWHPQGWFQVRDTCPQAGLLAIQGNDDSRNTATVETQLVSYPGHLETRHWTWDGELTLGGIILADSCKAICSGDGMWKSKETFHAACWSTQSGAKVAEDPKLTLTYHEAFGGSGGPRLAVTVSHWACRNGKFWQFFDIDGCATPQTHRVLWNIETGQEVLSWPVLNQPLRIGNRDTSGPFALALSSTGKFLAEGGAGRVQLYRVP